MKTHHLPHIRLSSFIIAGTTLVLVSLGSYVRATGAGLACPDWPLCFERVIPESFSNGVMQEVVHRYIAGATVFMTALFIFFCAQQRQSFPRLWKLSIVLGSLLILQAVLGGLTVLMKLNPLIVTLHLTCGTLFLQSFLVIARNKDNFRFIRTQNISLFLGFLVFCQMILGGLVGSSGASLACLNFPLCVDSYFPSLTDALFQHKLIHIVHRTMGVVLFTAIVSFPFFPGVNITKKRTALLYFLVTTQVLLGMLNIFLRVPSYTVVGHLLVAQLLLWAILETGIGRKKEHSF